MDQLGGVISSGVVRLEGQSNWSIWKFQMKIFLNGLGLMSVIDGTGSKQDDKEWLKKDAKAQSLLVSKLSENAMHWFGSKQHRLEAAAVQLGAAPAPVRFEVAPVRFEVAPVRFGAAPVRGSTGSRLHRFEVAPVHTLYHCGTMYTTRHFYLAYSPRFGVDGGLNKTRRIQCRAQTNFIYLTQ
ncbi:hypothetical protein ACJJTC_018412 [Scirpophaga incertulas]